MKTLLLGVLSVLIATVAAAQPVSLDAIVRDPIKFDRRVVVLRGEIGLIENVGGRPAFTLIDRAWSIRVMAPPQARLRQGDRVEVEGMFSHAGNQIDALRVTPR